LMYAAAKLEDGNTKAAIRILNSEDSLSHPHWHLLSKLQKKHPPASSSCCHNFRLFPWMRRKCAKHFLLVHQEVHTGDDTACDLSTYATPTTPDSVSESWR